MAQRRVFISHSAREHQRANDVRQAIKDKLKAEPAKYAVLEELNDAELAAFALLFPPPVAEDVELERDVAGGERGRRDDDDRRVARAEPEVDARPPRIAGIEAVVIQVAVAHFDQKPRAELSATLDVIKKAKPDGFAEDALPSPAEFIDTIRAIATLPSESQKGIAELIVWKQSQSAKVV